MATAEKELAGQDWAPVAADPARARAWAVVSVNSFDESTCGPYTEGICGLVVVAGESGETTLGPGDSIVVPAGHAHRLVAESAELLEVALPG